MPIHQPPPSAATPPPAVTVDDAYLSKRESWALVASQPLAQLSNMALLPSLGAMRADLDLTYGELGAVVAAFGLARLAVDLPAGGLARRWNPRNVLLIAFATSTVVSALGMLARNGLQVAAVRLLIGVASSIAQAMILAWLVGGAGRVARGRVMARSEAFFSITGLVVPSLSGLLAGPLGWRVAFLLGAIAAAIGFVAILALTRPTGAARSVGLEPREPRAIARSRPPDAASAPEERQSALRTRPPGYAATRATTSPARAASLHSTRGLLSDWRELRQGGRVLVSVYIVTFVVFFCRNGLLNAMFPVLGADRFGIQPSEIGLLFSAINALSIGVVLLGGRVGDHFGRYQLLAPGLAVLLVCQLPLFVVQDPLSYVVVGLLQGLSFFVNPLPPSLLGDALPPRARPQAIAVYRAVSDLALLSAPALMGVALQLGGFTAAELASVAASAAALIAITALAVRRQPHPVT